VIFGQYVAAQLALVNKTCSLNYLLPPKRDNTVKLRKARLFKNIKASTNRFLNSFVAYCIRNFQ